MAIKQTTMRPWAIYTHTHTHTHRAQLSPIFFLIFVYAQNDLATFA